jgi:hypothetical protein
VSGVARTGVDADAFAAAYTPEADAVMAVFEAAKEKVGAFRPEQDMAPFRAALQRLSDEASEAFLVRLWRRLGPRLAEKSAYERAFKADPANMQANGYPRAPTGAPAYTPMVHGCAHLLKRSPGVSVAVLAELMSLIEDARRLIGENDPHEAALLRTLKKRTSDLARSPACVEQLRRWEARLNHADAWTRNSLVCRICREVLDQGKLPLRRGEAWSDAAIDFYQGLSDEDAALWLELFSHCSGQTAAAPSGKWSKEAVRLVDGIGADAFAERAMAWFALTDEPRTEPADKQSYGRWATPEHLMRVLLPEHEDVLKCLCWAVAVRPPDSAGGEDDAELSRVLGAMALSCSRKLPSWGVRSLKVANAATIALGMLPGEASLAQLAVLSVKAKNKVLLGRVAKSFDVAAERGGVSRDEIEEMAVPGFGLSSVGVLREELAGCTAELRLSDGRSREAATLTWTNEQGKPVKSVPAAVKRDAADELKELKALLKDVQKMVPAQRERLDGLFLARKRWPYRVWRERYLDHPVVGTLARRLVWIFHEPGGRTAAAWLARDPSAYAVGQGCLVTPDGSAFEPAAPDQAEVTIWHPIDTDAGDDAPGEASLRDDADAWRRFYEDRGVRQPFKQAHREVYLLTEAERRTSTYSNRFAAHILKQRQFNALAQGRLWNNPLLFGYDGNEGSADRVLSGWGFRVRLEYRGQGEPDGGPFPYISTDRLHFSLAADPNPWRPESVRLEEVPALLLSELMRDVDMFVGVASVGADPMWEDRGPDDGDRLAYWHSFASGELSVSARARRDLLTRLVPRLSIADRCELGERHLRVRGTRGAYRIHLGSGSVQMEPSGAYLCIVPASGGGRGRGDRGGEGEAMLPFEGDAAMSVILSKAFMLAEDHAITDRTITSQIERGGLAGG